VSNQAYLFWTDNPDYWEDISQCIDTRIRALTHHASQVSLNIEKLAERIRKTAREAGAKPGYEYGRGVQVLPVLARFTSVAFTIT